MMSKENFDKMSNIISASLMMSFKNLFKKMQSKIKFEIEPKDMMVNMGTNFVYVLAHIARKGAKNASDGREAGRFYAECTLWGVSLACVGMGLDVETILEKIAEKAKEDGPRLRDEYQAGIKS